MLHLIWLTTGMLTMITDPIQLATAMQNITHTIKGTGND